jgi:hypothetical protein
MLLTLATLASCRDDFDVNSVKSKPKLVLYCMPTVGDSTIITLTRSLPVNGQGSVSEVDGARISYTVNGQPATVIAEGNGRYKAVARQTAGDRVSIEAEADGLPAVAAQTTILAPVPITDVKTGEVYTYSEEWGESRNFLQLQATFTDPADTQDYYAVQVKKLRFVRENGLVKDEPYPPLDVDSILEVHEAYTDSDPLLRKLNSIDYDFGYDDNSYEQFFVFTDKDISGKTYTLRLNVYPDAFNGPNNHYVSPYFVIELYHITPEFYHFVSSIGNVENSDLTKVGLSSITPNVGNVLGGIGMAAGYASSKSKVVQHVYY